MQADDVPMAAAPPAFPKLPKSALFSKLQSFLPVMEQENKKLEEAVAAGEGAKHSIEVDEEGKDNKEAAEAGDTQEKPQVIEMNFALGMMENDDSDSENSSDDDEDGDIDLKSSILAAKTNGTSPDNSAPSAFNMQLSRDTEAKSRPLIQELN
uniref:Uncharacterized protein n=1 Tax=Globisporangium ultimum (strain ATCC 200006 / CBS 805.95 / DAOM BR144) TaxID=431595 RepID=K3X347_GLOUD